MGAWPTNVAKQWHVIEVTPLPLDCTLFTTVPEGDEPTEFLLVEVVEGEARALYVYDNGRRLSSGRLRGIPLHWLGLCAEMRAKEARRAKEVRG
jgi:hypothetical protein